MHAVPHPEKRKLCRNPENQPSMQPRRRRRVGDLESGEDIGNSRKEVVVASEEIDKENRNTILTGNQGIHKPKPKSIKTVQDQTIKKGDKPIQKGANQKGRKYQIRMKPKQVQKTKITNFFSVIQTKTPGLEDWGCSEQNGELYLIRGGGDTITGSGGVGRVLQPADQGVGEYLDRISDLQLATTSTNHE